MHSQEDNILSRIEGSAMKYYLNTPFEFATKGGSVYVLRRNALDKFIKEEREIDRDYVKNVIDNSRCGEEALQPYIFVCGGKYLQNAVNRIHEQGINIYLLSSSDTTSISPQINKNSFAIFIHADGSVHRLEWFDSSIPAIHFFFKMNYRYRSSVYWAESGRPCPRCVESLWDLSLSESYKELLKSRNLFLEEKQRSSYIDDADGLEVFYAIQDAIYIYNSILSPDVASNDDINRTEVMNRTSGLKNHEIFPVFPQCNHERFI